MNEMEYNVFYDVLKAEGTDEHIDGFYGYKLKLEDDIELELIPIKNEEPYYDSEFNLVYLNDDNDLVRCEATWKQEMADKDGNRYLVHWKPNEEWLKDVEEHDVYVENDYGADWDNPDWVQLIERAY